MHLQSRIYGKSGVGEGSWLEAQLQEAQMAVPRQKGQRKHSSVVCLPLRLVFYYLGGLKLDVCWAPASQTGALGFSVSAPVMLITLIEYLLCAGLCSALCIHESPSPRNSSMKCGLFCPLFIDEETEAQSQAARKC